MCPGDEFPGHTYTFAREGLDGQVEREIRDVAQPLTRNECVESLDRFIVSRIFGCCDELRKSEVIDSVDVAGSQSE